MKKLLNILIFGLIISLNGFSQKEKLLIEVANDSVTFKRPYTLGTFIYQADSNYLYRLKTQVTDNQTLKTSSKTLLFKGLISEFDSLHHFNKLFMDTVEADNNLILIGDTIYIPGYQKIDGSLLVKGGITTDTIIGGSLITFIGDLLVVGNTKIGDTLFVSTHDTIFNDGDTSRWVSDKPIKIGRNSITVTDSMVDIGAIMSINLETCDTVKIKNILRIGSDDNNYSFPSIDGTAGQVLQTNGNGDVTWETVGGGGDYWSLTGNAGTNPNINFIGTTDNVPLTFKVNNELAGKIDNTLYNSFFGYQAGKSLTTGYENTFIGYHTGYSTTTGIYNTAIGTGALCANTTGIYNTAIGSYALRSNTEGASNTAIGGWTLYSNAVGNDNTAIGNYALYANTEGNYNTAIGYWAGFSNTTGYFNTANGFQALFSNTIGISNTANGSYALFSNTEGHYNTAIGQWTLYSNTTGQNNTAIGYWAGYSNTIGNNNAAIGGGALYNINTGGNNTATGIRALYSNTTGSYNIANGYEALYNNIGLYNTAIGSNAGYSNSTGSGNVFLGYQAGYYETNSNKFYLHNSLGQTNYATGLTHSLLYGTFNTDSSLQTLRINASTSNYGRLNINSDDNFNQLSVLSKIGTNGNNIFNFVSSFNKNRSTYAESIDTSSLSLSYTNSGSPLFQLKNKTGKIVFKTDSTYGLIIGGVPNTGVGATVFQIIGNSYSNGTFWSDAVKVGAGSDQALNVAYGGIFMPNSINGQIYLGTKIYFIGTQSHDIYVDANTTPATAGQNLNIYAGRTKSGNTDQNGGTLTLKPGLSTGTGFQSINLSRYSRAISTGTTDNTASEAMIIPSSKLIADNTSTNLFNVACVTGGSAGMTVNYTIKTQAGAGNESHTETGTLEIMIANDGIVTVSVTKSHSSQLKTDAGTYTITFAASTANPSVVSITADSTLDVNSKISYIIINKDEQVITQL